MVNARGRRVWTVAFGAGGGILISVLLGGVIDLWAGYRRAAELCIALGGGIVLWWLAQRFRLLSDYEAPCQVRLTPEGYAQRNGFGPVKLSPWTRDTRVDLTPARDGVYRLKIVDAPMRKGPIGAPVALEFECTELHAQWLQAQIALHRRT